MANIKMKRLPYSQLELEVILTDDEFKVFWQPAYEAALKKVSIKGFRPGAGPKDLLDKGVDKDKVFNTALEKAVRQTLDEEVNKNDWTIIDSPKIELLEAVKGVKYKATLTLFPEIRLGDYKKIAGRVLKERQKIEATEKEIQEAIDYLRKSRAATVLVNREAKHGDVVACDISAFVDDRELKNAQIKGDKFALGESRFLKGFDENLVGKKAGEKIKFSIEAPKEYWDKSVQGKKIDFVVDLKSVFERQLPEFNDEFAKNLGPSFKSAKEVKENITKGLRQEKEEKETERLRLKMLLEIAKDSKMEIPPIMIERTLEAMTKEMKEILPKDEKADLDKELHERLKPKAEESVKNHLVIFAISQKENLNPKAEEVEKEANLSSIDQEKHYDYIYERLQSRNVFTFLESQVK